MNLYTCNSCEISINEHENATLFINDDNELSIEYIVEQNHIYQGIVKDTADVGITNFYHIVKTELENKRVTTQFTTEFCILQVDFALSGITIKYKLFLPCHSKKIYGLTENTIDYEHDVNENSMNDSLSKLLHIPYPSDSETSSCSDYVTVTRRKNGASRGGCMFIDFGKLGNLLQRLLDKEFKPRIYDENEQIVVFGLFMAINGKFTMDRLIAEFENKMDVSHVTVTFDGYGGSEAINTARGDDVKEWIVDELRRGLAEMVFDRKFL